MSCLSSPPGDSRTITSRPKLTLQTAALPRTFGTSTTGLSLSFAAGTGASPTVRNTFKNAYDVSSPSSATGSPSKSSNHRFTSSKPISPYVLHPNNSNPFNYRLPYQLPLGLRSILRNSPLDTAVRRRSGSVSAGASGPGGAGTRRVFFPAKKQVSYRLPLEEEIRTERYTAQHLDLIQEEKQEAEHAKAESGPQGPPTRCAEDNDGGEESDSSLSQSETSTSGDETSADEGSADKTSLSKLERKKRRTMRIERQVRAVALLDGLEPDSYTSSTPHTPHQGRAKRRREWKWTLGPLDTGPGSAQSEPATPLVSTAVSSCTVGDQQVETKSSQ
ncbi:uncharacterized protein N7459_001488 [Penicillium hispanicum]|uniref:uncharacterized protein n=1 Tax=Penicillium hispanicum TaxID=1080232 RepID=UPI002541C2DA|nr:uncharacterized protein N7459_001488 [Penicillium hispanicum]KAJ5595280.1 hypothetical protein N7459_001488 [Penicillium hispanicum]